MKKLKKLLILPLSLCLIFSLMGVNVLASEITDAQKKKQDLIEKQKDVKQILADLEEKKSNTQEYIEALDEQLADIEGKIGELEEKIETTEKELEQTKKDVEKAKEDEQNQYDAMKKRIQYMYMQGNTEYIEILINSDSIADFLNRSEYIKKISEYDQNMLVNYQNAKQLVLDKEAKIEEEMKSLEEMNADLKEQKEAVEVLIENKNTELENYNASISESKESISDYQSEISEQEDLIEDLLEEERKRVEAEEAKKKAEAAAKKKAAEEAAAKKKAAEEAAAAKKKAEEQQSSSNSSSSSESSDSSSSSTSVSSGGYAWPCPSSYRITSSFGYRNSPTAGASSYHKGIDIGASSGSSIVATKGGTVVTAQYSSSAGNYIMIYHGDGVYSYYMHCSQLCVSAGDTVSQGSVIGRVGSTGISTGPHLHFAITVNGDYVDPTNYVGN